MSAWGYWQKRHMTKTPPTKTPPTTSPPTISPATELRKVFLIARFARSSRHDFIERWLTKAFRINKRTIHVGHWQKQSITKAECLDDSQKHFVKKHISMKWVIAWKIIRNPIKSCFRFSIQLQTNYQSWKSFKATKGVKSYVTMVICTRRSPPVPALSGGNAPRGQHFPAMAK